MREQTTIVTPQSKAQVVINNYITGREKRALTDIFLNKDITDVEKYHDAQDKAFEFVIVSINGKKNGDSKNEDGSGSFSIVEAILDMSYTDSEFIIAATNDITNGKKSEEKKT